MNLAVVILNWNGSEETISCVDRIRQWTRIMPNIFVVDNNSEEADKRNLVNQLKGIQIIENDTNEGFSEGCNIGIRAALQKYVDAVLLLNNDAVIQENDLLVLIDKMKQNSDIAVIGPLIYDGETNRLINAGGKEIAWHYHTHLQRVKTLKKLYDVDYVSGTAVLIRSSIFETVGFFDKRYFFSGEIADFCKRIKRYASKAGMRNRIVIEPCSTALHFTHNPAKDREKLYAYYTIRNRYLYIRKYFKILLPFLYVFWFYHHMRHAFSCLKQKRMDVTGYIFKGIFHGMIGTTGRLAE